MRNEAQILDRALSLHNMGDIAGAAKLYERIIKKNPHNLQAVHFLGVAEAASGNLARAKLLMKQSLEVASTNVDFIENYAAVLHRAGEHDELVHLCRHALPFAPASLALLHAGAAGHLALGQFQEAVELLTRLIKHHPHHFPAHVMLGSALAKSRHHDQALASYHRALELQPRFAEAHLDIGTIHFANRRHGEALAAYDRAIAIRPDLVDAWVGRGNALLDLGRIEEATAAYDQAVALRPQLASAWCGKGNALLRSGRQHDAVIAFDNAIAAEPGFAEAWVGRGTAALFLGRHDDASASFDRAIACNPQLAGAWLGKGQVSYQQKRYEEALAAWEKAIVLNPDQAEIAAACLRIKMHLCDWTDFETGCETVRSAVRNSRLVSPLMLVAVPSTPIEQLQCARSWVTHHHSGTGRLPGRNERRDQGRIRLAYLSADFHQHATSHLIAGVLEHHDREVFEVTAISIGPDDGSEMRRRVVSAFDRFIDAKPLGDAEIADMIHRLEIDILVDLKGFTQDARTGVFARRPAPLQVNYLGFPGTMGAEFIDYIVADRHVIPEGEAEAYQEKIVWMPESYQPNDRNRAIAEEVGPRAVHGLPEDAFVFCCFNDNYKITPEAFSAWMRILGAVEGSVLWLFEDNSAAAGNLRAAAARRGIDPRRLVFAGRLPPDVHLARQRCADLFLDTLPYGAHTTASDALWACLPVLTCRGQTFAGRVGVSLLNAIRLPELVTETPEAYERLAIELAHDRQRLAALRAKLAVNRLRTPLYDTTEYTRQLETAYAAIMRRYRAGLPPDHIRLPGETSCP
ncbi:tetratricopeptide repeat protein [Bradyrhizobium sp. CCH5-F6]|jgi:protein O-GlcNAc transferase|uniref:tetratricopeptide repeat protein n=1 Tax=Bradyrhizobium sp. CCH5-F6 TaxID=1768753 RepID=UPI0007C7CD78|nr:tetratricopeptide repeat protein [Bradyrhizobium sp. CCH5-F6]